MPMNENREAFETQPCTRCGGSGWHSYCQTWGKTCFQCGVRPFEQGIGRYLSRRGKAAYDYYLSLLPTRRADELRAGDVFLDDGYRAWATVKEAHPAAAVAHHSGPHVEIWTIKHGILVQVPADRVFRMKPTPEEKQRCTEEAVAYQATLTKNGTVRKRRVAA